MKLLHALQYMYLGFTLHLNYSHLVDLHVHVDGNLLVRKCEESQRC